MKLYRNLLLSASALLCVAGFSSCEEDDTLDGANVVYIDMNPSSYTLSLGDTLAISARVSNESGNTINTPISWKVDDESVAKILGDTAIVAVNGGQGKTTKLRATLENGKYGVAEVSVINNNPDAVAVLDTLGNPVAFKNSYDIRHDSVVFTIRPKELLLDFEPTYKLEGVEEYEANPIYIDREAGTVGIHYSAPRKYGQGSISVTIGEGSTAATGTIAVRMDPPLEGATFYGPDYADQPYMGSRPPQGTLRMWYMTSYDRMMDVNTYDTCRVAVNIQTGNEIDIKEAYKCYRWEAVEGSSVLVSAQYEEYVENNGFDAVLVVQSGILEGESMFRFVTPMDTLTAQFRVYNYTESYPVEEILTDPTEVNVASGETMMMKTSVVPMSSYGFHKPKVVAADPEIIYVGEYIGNEIPLTGGKAGTTYLTLTSNGKTLTVPVTVKEAVSNILWGDESGNNNLTTLFANQETEWKLRVQTPSGEPNPYPVSVVSTADSIASGEGIEGDDSRVIIRANAKGTAGIRAKVLNITSDNVDVTVVDVPKSGNVFGEKDYIGVFFNNGELQFSIEPDADSQLNYSMVLVSLAGVSTGDVAGTFTPGEGSTAVFDNAVATITAGNVTITRSDSGDLLISGTLTINVPGNGEVTWTLDNVVAEEW